MLDELAPIDLASLGAGAALQDRVDRKYVVDGAVLGALLGELAATHRVLEIDSHRVFAYATTYFDTPDLRCLREHLQGRRRRWKARRRHYLDSGAVAIELKTKATRGRTVKASQPADGGAAPAHGPTSGERASWDGAPGPTAAERAFLDAALRETYGHGLPGPLVPVLDVRCRRLTLAAPELGERVTCDVALDFGGPALLPGTAIVECKSPHGRSLADGVLRRLGARPVSRCSKYCLGMALTRPDVRANDLLALLRRHFAAETVAVDERSGSVPSGLPAPRAAA